MSVLSTSSTIADLRSESTHAVPDEVLAHPRQDWRRRWDEVIDGVLVEWGANPGQLEDEGIIAPAGPVIDLACQLAIRLRDGVDAPTAVVPNGDGGIVFRWNLDDGLVLLEVLSDGEVLVSRIKNGELQERGPIRVER